MPNQFNKYDFNNKKVLIMGLGIQGGGAGMARFFIEEGAKVTVTDLKTAQELKTSLDKLANLPINFILGQHREEDFKNADLIIRNPDVPRDSPFLKIAREAGVPIEMDESLFLKLCPKRENVIGVTGTRGKTTTTHLIGAILKKAGYHVLLGGNLRGVATLSLLNEITSETKVVLELSSWQLQGLDNNKISPHIAVITNIYQDHLNRYKDTEEYVNDKKNIYKYQTEDDFLVLNKSYKSDRYYRNFAEETKSKVVWFLRTDVTCRGAFGFKLKGEHNLENLAAAYQVAKILKIDDRTIRRGIEEFKGVEFRLQEIARMKGILYINDATSTTPEATIAALRAYKDKPIILICGGSSKKLDVSKLGKEIARKVKAVILLEGSGTDELIKNSELRIANDKILGRFDNLKEAVLAAKMAANPGDVVLLSPGFASFGMFKNEYERGEKFNEIILSSAKKTL